MLGDYCQLSRCPFLALCSAPIYSQTSLTSQSDMLLGRNSNRLRHWGFCMGLLPHLQSATQDLICDRRVPNSDYSNPATNDAPAPADTMSLSVNVL